MAFCWKSHWEREKDSFFCFLRFLIFFEIFSIFFVFLLLFFSISFFFFFIFLFLLSITFFVTPFSIFFIYFTFFIVSCRFSAVFLGFFVFSFRAIIFFYVSYLLDTQCIAVAAIIILSKWLNVIVSFELFSFSLLTSWSWSLFSIFLVDFSFSAFRTLQILWRRSTWSSPHWNWRAFNPSKRLSITTSERRATVSLTINIPLRAAGSTRRSSFFPSQWRSAWFTSRGFAGFPSLRRRRASSLP